MVSFARGDQRVGPLLRVRVVPSNRGLVLDDFLPNEGDVCMSAGAGDKTAALLLEIIYGGHGMFQVS